MRASEFFQHPQTAAHKKYEALRAFYVEGKSAAEVAQQFGYTLSSFYSLTRDFKRQLSEPNPSQQFFLVSAAGRQPKDPTQTTQRLIVELRKKFLSVPDIKARLDALGYRVSERYIYNVVKQAGFSRLPRRSQGEKEEAVAAVKLPAPTTQMLTYAPESFSSCQGMGLLCLLPYLQESGLYSLIEQSHYPESQTLNRVGSILSFVALKLSNVRRYSADDLWCMDRGLGFFAGLNVLPKAAWFSSYAHRVTRTMNLAFLKSLHGCWQQQGLFLKGYDKKIRQLAIAGQGLILPALIITNDFDLPNETIIRKYARRWLVEQEIDEHLQFFHLNRLSSSMVIKVDFDLTMSILAHNLYRLLAADLPGFNHSNAVSLFEKFMDNGGQLRIDEEAVTVRLKKKRHLPLLLTALERFQNQPISWMQNRKFRVMADTSS